ncbi:MAG: GerMN domain-containing protein [Proteobacteria bacterium]|nr:GerMN domain-containing protein [Pseudomonadota bacterium]
MVDDKIKTKKNKSGRKGRRLPYFWVMVAVLLLVVISLFYFNRSLITGYRSFFTFPAKTWDATLLFGDERTDFLMREHRQITSSTAPEEQAKALISELIRGPLARGIRTLPKETTLRSVTMERNGLLTIDFGPELLHLHPGGSTAELMTIYSIVNTLTANIAEVKKVQFLFNGKPVETIAGHIDCSDPIYPKQDMVQQ